MKKRERIEIIKKELFSIYWDREIELDHENDFQLLIAIIMSAQATDKWVNKVNQTFFQYLKAPEDGIEMWEDKIREHIKRIGLFRWKSRNIHQTCLDIVHIYNGKIPGTIEELTKLPGVGIKTAKVYLWVTTNAPYLAVDTHVHRTLNRLWIVKTKLPLQTDKAAEKIFTDDDTAKLHHSLVLFGRYHCIARKPKCKTCPLLDVCPYKKKNLD